MSLRSCLSGLCFAIAACAGSPTSTQQQLPDCTLQAIPGIRVAVFDSATGWGLYSNSTAVARDGAFADTARVTFDANTLWLASERAGTYSLTVDHPGYRQWRRDGVTVTGDRCHVTTVVVAALLQP